MRSHKKGSDRPPVPLPVNILLPIFSLIGHPILSLSYLPPFLLGTKHTQHKGVPRFGLHFF